MPGRRRRSFTPQFKVQVVSNVAPRADTVMERDIVFETLATRRQAHRGRDDAILIPTADTSWLAEDVVKAGRGLVAFDLGGHEVRTPPML